MLLRQEHPHIQAGRDELKNPLSVSRRILFRWGLLRLGSLCCSKVSLLHKLLSLWSQGPAIAFNYSLLSSYLAQSPSTVPHLCLSLPGRFLCYFPPLPLCTLRSDTFHLSFKNLPPMPSLIGSHDMPHPFHSLHSYLAQDIRSSANGCKLLIAPPLPYSVFLHCIKYFP